MTKFFDMNLIDGIDASTAQAMFQSVDNQLKNHDISWKFCLAIGLDNRNANIGDHNSIKPRTKEKNGSIVIAVCSCHVLHNASCKAGEMFSQLTKFDIEDHTVDFFHWFDKSSKQNSLLKEHYEFCDTDYSEIIKFILTCWLCLEMCVNCELKKCEGLKSYFLSASGAGDYFRLLKNAFCDPMLEIYLPFYLGVLPVFTAFNKYLQREEPLIYQLSEDQELFMNKLTAIFIKPKVIQEIKNEEKSFAKFDISLQNQKDNIDLGIGQHCLKWLPLEDSPPQNCKFVDFHLRSTSSFDSVHRTVESFDTINRQLIESPELLDTLEEEFMEYEDTKL